MKNDRNKYTLAVTVCHGSRHTDEEIERGCEAAEKVFAGSEFTAIEAWEAFRAMCADEQHNAAASETWVDAECAALTAVDEGKPWHSDDLVLEISYEGDNR